MLLATRWSHHPGHKVKGWNLHLVQGLSWVDAISPRLADWVGVPVSTVRYYERSTSWPSSGVKSATANRSAAQMTRRTFAADVRGTEPARWGRV